MKNMQINIPHFRFILFNFKILAEIVTPFYLLLSYRTWVCCFLLVVDMLFWVSFLAQELLKRNLYSVI